MTTVETSDPTPAPRPNSASATDAGAGARPLPSRVMAALAGIVAALIALGVGELVAGLVGAPSPLASVGSALIDYAPPGSKEIIVSLFGTNDKPALELMVAAVVLAIGSGIGILARTRFTLADGGHRRSRGDRRPRGAQAAGNLGLDARDLGRAPDWTGCPGPQPAARLGRFSGPGGRRP
jgi:hypothetical protein